MISMFPSGDILKIARFWKMSLYQTSPPFLMLCHSSFQATVSNHNCGPFDMNDDEQLLVKEIEQQQPMQKRGSSHWMETAASTLSELTKEAKSSPK